MLQRERRSRPATKARQGIPVEVAPDLHDMIATKLWRNPCWLSFRVNYIAHHFNQPVYDHVWRKYRLSAPEHIVLYALGLKEGITADDIVVSSSRPKNTLSRGVNALLRKKLIRRVRDRRDRRQYFLFLTARGRSIVDRTVPLLVEQERAMFASLSNEERIALQQLLTKIVLGQRNWPTRIEGRP